MGEYVVRAGYQRGAGAYLVWWSAIDQAWSGDQRGAGRFDALTAIQGAKAVGGARAVRVRRAKPR